MKYFLLNISLLFTIFLSSSVHCQDKLNHDSIFKDKPVVEGYIMPMYEYGEDVNQFRFKYLRIKSKGNLNKYLGYFIQVDAAGELTLKDALIDIRLNKFFNITAGQLPYHLGVYEAPWNHPTVYRPQIRRIMLGDPRDFGVLFYGSLKKLDYYAYILNGTARGVREDDNKKTFLLSLDYNVGSNLKVGVSQYSGSRNYTDESKFVYGAERNRSAAYFWYQAEKLMVRGEYMRGKDYIYSHSGYYFIAGYFITQKLQPVFRYDFFETEMKNFSSRIWAPGLNVIFNDKFYTRSLVEFNQINESRIEPKFVLELGFMFL